MVHLVKLWDTFVEYAQNMRQGFYIEKPDIDGVQIKIVAGRLAYETRSLPTDDPLYDIIQEFLKVHEFTKIETSVDPDLFLR